MVESVAIRSALMESSVAFDDLLIEIDGMTSSLEQVLAIHRQHLGEAAESGDTDKEADARLGVNRLTGQLEAIRAIRATAVEARDVQRLPFERMIGALESSYLTLDNALDQQRQTQQRAFQTALAGGSRFAFEQETDNLNLAGGRLEEVTRWLHRARALEG